MSEGSIHSLTRFSSQLKPKFVLLIMKKLILVLQKRALRLMFFAEPRTRAVPLFSETKQLPISFLLFEQMNLLMYDVHNNLAPDNIKNMFTKLSSVHSYRTRSVTNENYYVEQVRTENGTKQQFLDLPTACERFRTE